MTALRKVENVLFEVVELPEKGRGVITHCLIKNGDIFLRCDALLVDENDLTESSKLKKYLFDKSYKESYLCCGIGAFFNSDLNANIRGLVKDNVIEFTALRDIEAGEELSMCYLP